MTIIYTDFMRRFDEALTSRNDLGRRIGSEMKFPLVNAADGTAAEYAVVEALWSYLESLGWRPDVDESSGKVVGARKAGEYNDTVASCETGYCKVEFSFAHVGDLFELERQVNDLRTDLQPFCEDHGVRFMGYGIQPVTPPSRRLLMKKSRANAWDRFYVSNNRIAPEDGHDLHLFTINAASHCHLSIRRDEAIPLVNALNGFSGAQLALTADSSVWKGRVDPELRCVSEKFWDWWIPEPNRTGVPTRRFRDLEDYCEALAGMRPVFVKRAGRPVLLEDYETFGEFYIAGRAKGVNLEGQEVTFQPERSDLDLHNTCYWYNARISSYYTVENRTNDQQPPSALLAVPALSLGVVGALDEANEALAPYEWETLRALRDAACRDALGGEAGGVKTADLADRLLSVAETGLRRRGKGEAAFLAPLRTNLRSGQCPADEAALTFEQGGAALLVKSRSF